MPEFWDLGDAGTITPSKDSLYRILDAVIRLRGRIHDTHCLELNSDGSYRYPTRGCSVVFRISLPEGCREQFEALTGFKLRHPPRASV